MTIVKAPSCPALYSGLSTDTKPGGSQKTGRLAATAGKTVTSIDNDVPSGALFYQSDTSTWFRFEGDSQNWVQLKSNPV